VVDNDYAPYSFQTDDGKLHGIVIDQWNVWEKKTGIRVEIQATDWAQALRRMRAREFDVIDTIFFAEKRRAYFDSQLHMPPSRRRSSFGPRFLASRMPRRCGVFRLASKRGTSTATRFSAMAWQR